MVIDSQYISVIVNTKENIPPISIQHCTDGLEYVFRKRCFCFFIFYSDTLARSQ